MRVGATVGSKGEVNAGGWPMSYGSTSYGSTSYGSTSYGSASYGSTLLTEDGVEVEEEQQQHQNIEDRIEAIEERLHDRQRVVRSA